MSFRVAKRADSVDPRDWHYLQNWQRRATYMPPWNYSFTVPDGDTDPMLPAIYNSMVFVRSDLSDHNHDVRWYQNYFVDLPPPIDDVVLVWALTCELTVLADGATDGLGNPVTHELYFSLLSIGRSQAFAHEYFNLPPYDHVFTFGLKYFLGGDHADYPNGVTMRPVIWNHPAVDLNV